MPSPGPAPATKASAAHESPDSSPKPGEPMAFEIALMRAPEGESAPSAPRQTRVKDVLLVLAGLLLGGLAVYAGLHVFTPPSPALPPADLNASLNLSPMTPPRNGSLDNKTQPAPPSPPPKGRRLDAETIRLAMEALGAGQLHEAPLSDEPPLLLVDVLDRDEVYGVEVVDGTVTVAPSSLDDPDVTISLYAREIEALDPDRYLEGLRDLYQRRRLGVTYHKSTASLALKGYRVLAERFE